MYSNIAIEDVFNILIFSDLTPRACIRLVDIARYSMLMSTYFESSALIFAVCYSFHAKWLNFERFAKRPPHLCNSDNNAWTCTFLPLACVGFVAAAVSKPMGGCRAKRPVSSLPVVVVDVPVAAEPAVL